MKYESAPDLKEKIKDLVEVLEMKHIELDKVECFRSYGTNSRRVIARCHGLPKVMQLGMKTSPFYVIEVINERFGKMNEEEQTKVLLHELLHIPKTFGGGFRQHDFVNRQTVERLYREYKRRKEIKSKKAQEVVNFSNVDSRFNSELNNHMGNESQEKRIGLVEKIIQNFNANKKEDENKEKSD